MFPIIVSCIGGKLESESGNENVAHAQQFYSAEKNATLKSNQPNLLIRLICFFSPKVTFANRTTIGVIQSTSSSSSTPLKRNHNVMSFFTVLTFISFLVICMDIEMNRSTKYTPQFNGISGV